MPEINLLQTEKRFPLAARASRVSDKPAFLVLVILLVIAFGVYGGFYSRHKSMAKQLVNLREEKIKEAEEALDSQREQIQQAVAAQNALTSFATLLEQHVHWTKVWQELSKVTLKKARLAQLQGKASENHFVVSGEVASYTDLGKLILGLQTSPNFLNIKLLNSGPAAGQSIGVSFEISVTVEPSLLLKAKGLGGG